MFEFHLFYTQYEPISYNFDTISLGLRSLENAFTCNLLFLFLVLLNYTQSIISFTATGSSYFSASKSVYICDIGLYGGISAKLSLVYQFIWIESHQGGCHSFLTYWYLCVGNVAVSSNQQFIEEISKSNHLEAKVTVFNKTLQRGIYLIFPYNSTLYNMLNVTNVEFKPNRFLWF